MIRSNRIRLFIRMATFISILSLFSCEKHRATTLPWDNDIQNRAIAYLEAGNCNDFWELVFPYAKANQPITTSLIAIFQSDIFQESGGDDIAQCLATGMDVNGCIEKAIEADLLPSFAQWIDEVERLGKNKGNARCTRINESQKLDDDDFDIKG